MEDNVEGILKYGTRVRDSVTGYSGIVTCYAKRYGHGPDGYLVESMDSTGRPVGEWVNADRIEVI